MRITLTGDYRPRLNKQNDSHAVISAAARRGLKVCSTSDSYLHLKNQFLPINNWQNCSTTHLQNTKYKITTDNTTASTILLSFLFFCLSLFICLSFSLFSMSVSLFFSLYLSCLESGSKLCWICYIFHVDKNCSAEWRAKNNWSHTWTCSESLLQNPGRHFLWPPLEESACFFFLLFLSPHLSRLWPEIGSVKHDVR